MVDIATLLTPEDQKTVDAMVEQVNSLLSKRNAEAEKGLDERDNALMEKFDELVKAEMGNLREFYENQMKTFRVPGLESSEENPKDGFSIARAAVAHHSKDWGSAPVELEVKRQMERQGAYEKAQSLGTDADGGFLVPEEQAESVIERLYANACIFKLGATRLEGLDRSPYTFPRLSASLTASWGAEASTITASDVTLEQVSMSPKELKSMNIYSNTLLRTSHPSIDALIMDDMAQQHALGLDLGAMTGDGTGGAPTGIANQSGVLTAAVGATTAATYNEFLGFPNTMRNNDSLRGSLGWALAPETFAELTTMVDASNQPRARRVFSDGPMDMILGYPYETSSQLPATVGAADSVIFGNWADLWVGFWGPLEIVTSNAPNFATNQMNIRGVLYCDAAVRHPESFCVAT